MINGVDSMLGNPQSMGKNNKMGYTWNRFGNNTYIHTFMSLIYTVCTDHRRSQDDLIPNGLQTALEVGRHRFDDFLRIRQLQIGHEFDELGEGLGEAGIGRAFLVDRRTHQSFVVVAWV